MESKRARHSGLTTIANGAAISAAVDFRKFTTGVFHMPAVWTAAQVGYKVAQSEDGTYLPLYDASGNLVTVVAAVDTATEFTAELAAAPWFKFWSQNGSAVDVNQDALRTILYDLKG